MIELKKCPKCGEEPELCWAFLPPENWNKHAFPPINQCRKIYWVRHIECGMGTCNCDSVEKAIEKWNKKVELF